MRSLLEEIRALSRVHDFRVAVVAFPVSFQVQASHLEDAPQRRMRELTKEFGFEYLDLLPVLREHAQERLYFDQCHPTIRGNAIAGEAVAEFMREMIQTLGGGRPPREATSPSC